MLYDSADDTLILFNGWDNGTTEESAMTRVVKMTTGGTIVAERDLAALMSSCPTADVNPLPTFEGQQSFFVGLQDQALGLSANSLIVQLNADDLSVIQGVRLPGIYTEPLSPLCDPEGRMWVHSKTDVDGSNGVYLHAFGPPSLDEKTWSRGFS